MTQNVKNSVYETIANYVKLEESLKDISTKKIELKEDLRELEIEILIALLRDFKSYTIVGNYISYKRNRTEKELIRHCMRIDHRMCCDILTIKRWCNHSTIYRKHILRYLGKENIKIKSILIN